MLKSFKQRWIPDWKFSKKVLILLMPVLLGSMLDNGVFFLDNFMAAPLGETGMAAVGAVNEVLFFASMAIIGACIMVNILLAQVYGAKDKDRFHDYLRVKMFLAYSVGIVMVLVTTLFPEMFIKLFIIGEDINAEFNKEFISQGVTYLRLMMLSEIIWIISYVFLTTLTITGKTKYTLYISLSSIAINLVFNIIFVKTLNLGIAGLAYATIIARSAEGVILVIAIIMNKEWLLPTGGVWFKKSHFIKVMKNWKLWLGNVVWCLGNVAQTMIWSNFYDAKYLGGLSITFAVGGILFTAFPAIGTAIRIIVGHELGANNLEVAKDKSRKILPIIISMTIGLIPITLLIAYLVPWEAYIDGASKETVDFIHNSILVFIIMIPFSVVTAYSFAHLEAGGFTTLSTIGDKFLQILLLIPVALILASFTDLSIFWSFAIVTLLNILPAFIAWPAYLKGKWARKIIE